MTNFQLSTSEELFKDDMECTECFFLYDFKKTRYNKVCLNW